MHHLKIPTKVHPDFKRKFVPIKDNGEELIQVAQLNTNQIIEDPQYVKQGIDGALEHCYVRESAAQQLMQAAKELPSGYQFVIWDGYRPYEVQKAIYDDYYRTIQLNNPEKGESDWRQLTEDFVSYPSIDKEQPAPHITGGAVDLAIVDAQGELLDFGTAFDDFTEKAHTAYFEQLGQQRDLTKEEQIIRDNRRLLYHVLAAQGFTNYSLEWWHFDYGNQWWAQQQEKSRAIYGVAQLTDV
ncbi:D-alanyl-D-alanine dipeptidase [Gracilibacillus halotolerans]|uniref:D-alanyl-D-alanine dipeptidase n=1 Tax=Gracilibacillus halotolerans TaxID=74386 RepID=A0A841RQN5_9BACI|nr:M15 family metallopeptidase [Gracilibacillus halotolerans]MBB6514142.1 D-alanyl-D-alanine dipeptidase [Gracilibacillus halotolerans]